MRHIEIFAWQKSAYFVDNKYMYENKIIQSYRTYTHWLILYDYVTYGFNLQTAYHLHLPHNRCHTVNYEFIELTLVFIY